MKKWFKGNDKTDKRLTRKERYVRKYMNSDKCVGILSQLQDSKLIGEHDTCIGSSTQRVRRLFPDVESVLNPLLQTELLSMFNMPTHQQVSPIIAVFAVGFHHKRGSEIEYCYPEMNTFTDDSDTLINKVTVYALPDAVHNTDEDYLYFNFKARVHQHHQILYGVTCFKQIKVTQAMKLQDPELTRGHIQKAICMLSVEPIFGYLKNRLEPTIKAYFQMQNFKDTSIIQFAYQNIQQTLDYNVCIRNLELSETYIDTNLTSLFYLFKDKTFKIIKALLLELKIIVYSLSSSICSKFMISLLSLIPGLLQFNMHTKATMQQLFYLSNYGLPLQIFNEHYPLYLHFSVNDLPEVLDNKISGYLIGTTNKFLKTMPKLNPDIIIDIDAETVTIIKEEHKKLLNTKIHDKLLYTQIHQGIQKNLEATTKEQLRKFGPILNQSVQFYGGDDWIRKLIHEYVLKFLIDMSFLETNYQAFDHKITKMAALRARKSILLNAELSNSSDDEEQSQQQVYQANIDNKVEEIKKTKEELLKELSIKDYRNNIHNVVKSVSKYNKRMALYWLCNTRNGRQWLIQHDYSIQKNCEYYQDIPGISYQVLENGDILISDKEQQCAMIEQQHQKVYVGQLLNNMKHGEGRYETMITKKYQYRGQFMNNMKHGDGKLIVADEFQYNGHFENDQFNGYGNLQIQDQVYEGWFINGKYSGTGKLIMPSRDVYVGQFNNGQYNGEGQYVWSNGDIYKGTYKNNKKHGMGIFQNKEYIYEGEYVDDVKEGFGTLQLLSNQWKYQGQFSNDILVANQSIIIKYPNDSIYQGLIQDWKPHGKGYLTMKDGTEFDGEFVDGEYLNIQQEQ